MLLNCIGNSLNSANCYGVHDEDCCVKSGVSAGQNRASSPIRGLYEQVSERILQLIEGGTLRPGQRVPSVRE
jgi:hypothetical protein